MNDNPFLKIVTVTTLSLNLGGVLLTHAACVDDRPRIVVVVQDLARNARNAAIISRADGPVSVRAMRINGELMIARHTRDPVGSSPSVKRRGPGKQERTS